MNKVLSLLLVALFCLQSASAVEKGGQMYTFTFQVYDEAWAGADGPFFIIAIDQNGTEQYVCQDCFTNLDRGMVYTETIFISSLNCPVGFKIYNNANDRICLEKVHIFGPGFKFISSDDWYYIEAYQALMFTVDVNCSGPNYTHEIEVITSITNQYYTNWAQTDGSIGITGYGFSTQEIGSGLMEHINTASFCDKKITRIPVVGCPQTIQYEAFTTDAAGFMSVEVNNYQTIWFNDKTEYNDWGYQLDNAYDTDGVEHDLSDLACTATDSEFSDIKVTIFINYDRTSNQGAYFQLWYPNGGWDSTKTLITNYMNDINGSYSAIKSQQGCPKKLRTIGKNGDNGYYSGLKVEHHVQQVVFNNLESWYVETDTNPYIAFIIDLKYCQRNTAGEYEITDAKSPNC